MSDTPQLLLAHHLKALKLPTFLREYDKLQRQRRWFDLKAVGGEHEQQLEARGIGVARVPAGAPLASESVAQERLDEGSNRRHADLPSDMNASPAVATSRKRSAVASRYQ